MNIYAILTCQVNRIGGTQLYSINKAKYLSQNGWKVFLFHAGKENTPIVEIDTVNYYNFPFLQTPPYKYLPFIVHRYVNKLVKIIGASENDRVIIESHADKFPMWGELIAAKLKAKNLCIPLNECYRGHGRLYKNKLDFFSFKFD